MALFTSSWYAYGSGGQLRAELEIDDPPESVPASMGSVALASRLYIRTNGSLYDSVNTNTLTGTLGSSSGSNSVGIGSGGGRQLLRTVSANVPTVYGSTVTVSMTGTLKGYEVIGTGTTVTVTGSVIIPARMGYIAPHVHAVIVGSSTLGTTSSNGATTNTANSLPVSTQLLLLQATEGNMTLRSIGLWFDDEGSTPGGLTICDGRGGTPDLTGTFVVDADGGNIGETVGQNTHSHNINSHTHTLPSHTHTLQFGASGAYHTHPNKNTSGTTPTVTAASGTTSTSNNIPASVGAYFVRLDGVGTSDLEAPVTVASQWGSVVTTPIMSEPGMSRLSTADGQITVCEKHGVSTAFATVTDTPVGGGLATVTSSARIETLTLTIGVVGLSQLEATEQVLASPLLHVNLWGSDSGWFIPTDWEVSPETVDAWSIVVKLVKTSAPVPPDPETVL